jgi:hypothetical protein
MYVLYLIDVVVMRGVFIHHVLERLSLAVRKALGD